MMAQGRPRVGFVMEQALGHVAYSLSLRRALANSATIECEWLDVSFAESGFERIPVVGGSYWARGNLRARDAIARAHRRRPLDALFVHTPMIGVLSSDYFARIPTMISLDATPRNYDELAWWYGHKVGHPSIEYAKHLTYRTVMGLARRATTWSQWTKDSLVDEYGLASDAVTVIHPGTTFEKISSPRAREQRRPGPMRILFVGGDFKRKGGDLLVDVYRRHLRSACELHLVTPAEVPAGDGVFVYPRMKPNSAELMSLYADADVFAFPTRADCFGVVLAEAMAAALPIVTTRVAAIPEAVKEGESGFIIEVDDADALRDRLTRLLESPALRIHMGAESRRVGEERFDIDKNAEQIARLLVDMAAGTGRLSRQAGLAAAPIR
jgi:glycosyltransferase involved in cell wall biosynthesis